MTPGKTLMVAIMDIPYESADSTTALHIIHAALKDGHNVRVFDMEGAVNPTATAGQLPCSSMRETAAEEERGTATKDRAAASLFQFAKQRGVKLDWVNCGFCVDDKEAGDSPEGLQTVGPEDLVDASLASDATMVILVPTK
jgi:tRNA 2-thiouridine synthesizing protein D